MENGGDKTRKMKKWGFTVNEKIVGCDFTIRGTTNMLMSCLNNGGQDNDLEKKPTISFAYGDPSPFPSFRITPVAEDAIVEALRSARFNSYSPTGGIIPARRAIAEYLSHDLPTKLSAKDIFLTAGATQGIEIIISVLARPGANILLPRPGYQYYETFAAFSQLEYRHFDLLPEQGWEVDLNAVEALADENTVAMVIINPGNPCGNVYTYKHLNKVAETAGKLGILVIADEVYAHISYGPNPFVPMGVFGSIAPVLTLGSLSKRWVVPGWRLGWIAAIDPNGVLVDSRVKESLEVCLNITTDPATFIQGAVPQILEKTNNREFFNRIINRVKQNSDFFVDKLKEIDCITCPHKPEGAMFTMVKLNVSVLEDIKDDMDFCIKLAKEESVIVLPGSAMGLKNWLRIMFATEPHPLEEGLERIKSFCQRHAK